MNCILKVREEDIYTLAECVEYMMQYVSRINICLDIPNTQKVLPEYRKQLYKISNVLEEYLKNGQKKEVAQLTDRIFLKTMNNCFAGEKNITLGVDGKKYICPAFYFVGDSESIDKKFFSISNSPVCCHCDAYQCQRCIFLSKERTGQYNIPSKQQCELSHLERSVSLNLLEKLHSSGIFTEYNIKQVSYSDPLEYMESNDSFKMW